MKLDPCLTPYTKIYLKMNQKLNISTKSIKVILEVNIGVNLHDHGLGNDLLGMIPKAQPKEKIK